MFQNIDKKIQECKEFEILCTKWITDGESQIKQMKQIKDQNSNMLATCKDLLKKHTNTSVVRKIDFEVVDGKTPPTPTRSISESQITQFSPSLAPYDYETPKKKAKHVHFTQPDDFDSDNETLIRNLLSTNNKNEGNPQPSNQRKRVRNKKI